MCWRQTKAGNIIIYYNNTCYFRLRKEIKAEIDPIVGMSDSFFSFHSAILCSLY
jgi:hypothetical protein